MTEQEYRDAVYAEAKKISSPEELSNFIKRLSDYQHDYGTIVYACAAARMAAWRVVDKSPQGGITGFQAGCVMWETVKDLGRFSEGPLKILDFDNIRFPQYDDSWGVSLSRKSAAVLSERAKSFLDNNRDCNKSVLTRNKNIAAGKFPAFVTITDR